MKLIAKQGYLLTQKHLHNESQRVYANTVTCDIDADNWIEIKETEITK